MKGFGPKCYRYVDLGKAVGGQAMGNNPVSSMDPGGSAYYSMENYVDNRGNRFYLSPGTIASLGLPWTGDPTGFTRRRQAGITALSLMPVVMPL